MISGHLSNSFVRRLSSSSLNLKLEELLGFRTFCAQRQWCLFGCFRCSTRSLSIISKNKQTATTRWAISGRSGLSWLKFRLLQILRISSWDCQSCDQVESLVRIPHIANSSGIISSIQQITWITLLKSNSQDSQEVFYIRFRIQKDSEEQPLEVHPKCLI